MGDEYADATSRPLKYFSALRARRLGLLSESVTEDELDSTIDNILSNILKNGPEAVAKAKDLVQ